MSIGDSSKDRIGSTDMKIDVTIDFTLDTPRYWDAFRNGDVPVKTIGDPDSSSMMLKRYHQIVWSRKLPCGEVMELQQGTEFDYLTWKDFNFGSDSILASFRWERYRHMHEELSKDLSDYVGYMEDFLHRAYTMGGMMIFPRHLGSINQMRGSNPYICDRWDLTMECIRRYYVGEDSPIYDTLRKDKAFFDLFVDFNGFVDFFFLQDCVSEDYGLVLFWLGEGEFVRNPLPKTIEEYLLWMDRQLEFVEKRNRRIAEAFR